MTVPLSERGGGGALPERIFALPPGGIRERITGQIATFRLHYSAEPTTLVELKLEEVANGVMLTVVESGFDRIPLARRAQAFSANEGGWSIMVKVLEQYLVQSTAA